MRPLPSVAAHAKPGMVTAPRKQTRSVLMCLQPDCRHCVAISCKLHCYRACMCMGISFLGWRKSSMFTSQRADQMHECVRRPCMVHRRRLLQPPLCTGPPNTTQCIHRRPCIRPTHSQHPSRSHVTGRRACPATVPAPPAPCLPACPPGWLNCNSPAQPALVPRALAQTGRLSWTKSAAHALSSALLSIVVE